MSDVSLGTRKESTYYDIEQGMIGDSHGYQWTSFGT